MVFTLLGVLFFHADECRVLLRGAEPAASLPFRCRGSTDVGACSGVFDVAQMQITHNGQPGHKTDPTDTL